MEPPTPREGRVQLLDILLASFVYYNTRNLRLGVPIKTPKHVGPKHVGPRLCADAKASARVAVRAKLERAK